MEQMPGHVLDDSSVPCEDCLRVDYLVLLRSGVDIPQADRVVIAGREQVPVEVWVPGQPVALLLVPSQSQIGLALSAWVRLAGVLRVVEHKHIAAWSLGGDDTGVLRHVASPVHLSLMVDLDLNLDLAGHRAKAAELALLIVIVGGVELRVLVGQLHAGDQQVVLLVASVRPEDQPCNENLTSRFLDLSVQM